MEKRLQLWSPVWGWLATKEGESVDLKGQDLVLYETAIQEALEQEKLYYRKKSAPFNLMDYYDADDSEWRKSVLSSMSVSSWQMQVLPQDMADMLASARTFMSV